MAATVQTGKQGDLVSGTPFDLASTQQGKGKSRIPEILVGTFLVALFALAGAWFYSTSTARTSYVVLRQDVQRGDVIGREDLTTYQINTDAPIRGIADTQLTTIIGEIALVDMQSGTMVTTDQFASQAEIAPGYGLVGLELSPGEYPSLSLQTGDRVRIVMLPDGELELTPGSISIIAENIEVVEVIGESSASRFISLALPTELADVVTVAHARNQVRLIQVPGDSSE